MLRKHTACMWALAVWTCDTSSKLTCNNATWDEYEVNTEVVSVEFVQCYSLLEDVECHALWSDLHIEATMYSWLVVSLIQNLLAFCFVRVMKKRRHYNCRNVTNDHLLGTKLQWNFLCDCAIQFNDQSTNIPSRTTFVWSMNDLPQGRP